MMIGCKKWKPDGRKERGVSEKKKREEKERKERDFVLLVQSRVLLFY